MNLLIDGTPKEIAEFIFELQDISVETTDDIGQLTDKVAAELATKINQHNNDRKIDSTCDCQKSSADDDLPDKCIDEILEILQRYPQVEDLKISKTESGIKRVIIS